MRAFAESSWRCSLCLGLVLLCLTSCRKHIAVAPAAQVPGWSAFSAPFDLIWDVDRGIDANGVPVNAKWAAQFSTPPGRPDFRDTCGAAFAPKGVQKGTGIDPALIGQCTTQARQYDVRPKNLITDPATLFLCPAKPLRGHLNWGVATYTGILQFAGWSSDFWLFDDDINFTLRTPGDAGLTTLGEGIHMEFRAGETLDQFVKTDWWSAFSKEVHQKNPFLKSNIPSLGKPVDGRIAIVTGLVGVDGVHGGYTESHRVYAMALRSEQHQTDTGVEETWDFFLRNHGTEGDCSLQEHHWSDFHGAYYVELPWPAGATAASVVGDPMVWSYLEDGVAGAGLEKADKCSLADGSETCTLLRLEVPNSKLPIGVYGELKLAYKIQFAAAFAASAAPPPPPPLASVEFEGGRPEQIKKRLSTLGPTSFEVRRNLPRDLANVEATKSQLRPSPPPPPPPKRIQVDPNFGPHTWPMAGDHREGSLQPDVAIPSPAKQEENAALNRAQASSKQK